MTDLIEQLSSFCPKERAKAFAELIATTPFPAEKPWVNMHLHTFFSYNGEGWSPTRIAYEMKKLGLYAAAVCDFDVLQAAPEFLAAADQIGLRGAAGFESRVFFNEYASQEINSPGEPGVFYFMGMGFVKAPQPGTAAADTLAAMLTRSHERNRAVIARINAKLNGFALDYDADVLPLTPEKNATERHIISAYNEKALKQFGGMDGAAAFWATTFGAPVDEIRQKISNTNGFNEFLRSKLIKRGGIGYIQPTNETFPPLEQVIDMILACRAIPMSAWLDGASDGEKDPMAQLECLMAKGVAAVNIIPDRNWNFKDPEVKGKKVAALNDYMAAARKLNLPVNVGTEGNKPGQRLVDDFECDALKPFAADFLAGAQVMVGHTRLLRYADVSFTDAAAKQEFACPTCRNAFFASVGALPAPSAAIRGKLEDMGCEKAFAYLKDSAAAQQWK